VGTEKETYRSQSSKELHAHSFIDGKHLLRPLQAHWHVHEERKSKTKGKKEKKQKGGGRTTMQDNNGPPCTKLNLY